MVSLVEWDETRGKRGRFAKPTKGTHKSKKERNAGELEEDSREGQDSHGHRRQSGGQLGSDGRDRRVVLRPGTLLSSIPSAVDQVAVLYHLTWSRALL
eukprot:scaffold741_cov336-Pavlova_lutheri.AAC.41